jgi:hypothetical protein
VTASKPAAVQARCSQIKKVQVIEQLTEKKLIRTSSRSLRAANRVGTIEGGRRGSA